MNAPAKNPKVSLITVNYKTPHFIRHLLQGVEEAKLNFPFEYFLVDNDSRDQTVSMVKEKFPWAKVIASKKNIGFGGGNNLAIKQAKGEYVLLMNPDLTLFPGELEAWIDWMDANPDVGISGPRIVNPDGSDQDSCYRFPHLFIPLYRRTFLGRIWFARKSVEQYLMKDMDRTKEQEVDWVLGAALLVRRELLERIGAFDERFFMYFEDADLCRRAWSAGMRVVYTPVAKLIHYHQRQSRTRFAWQAILNPVTRIHIASGFKYFRKYRGKPNPRLAFKQQTA